MNRNESPPQQYDTLISWDEFWDDWVSQRKHNQKLIEEGIVRYNEKHNEKGEIEMTVTDSGGNVILSSNPTAWNKLMKNTSEKRRSH